MTETRTATLAEFLLARIAEDEAVLATTEAFPHSNHGYDPVGSVSETCPSCRRTVLGARAAARIGAECEAKRRIVAKFQAAEEMDSGNYAYGAQHALEDVVRLLALPYADHPDYREEWRP